MQIIFTDPYGLNKALLTKLGEGWIGLRKGLIAMITESLEPRCSLTQSSPLLSYGHIPSQYHGTSIMGQIDLDESG